MLPSRMTAVVAAVVVCLGLVSLPLAAPAAAGGPDSLALAPLPGDLPAGLLGPQVSEGGWLVVRFDAATEDASRRALLRSANAEVAGFIPPDGLLARVPAAAVARLAATPVVTGLVRLHPAHKLEASLLRGGLESAARLRLTLAPGTDVALAQAAVEGAGARLLEAWNNGMRVEATGQQQLVALARLDDVLFIEPAIEARLYNDSSRGICQTSEVGNERVHQHGIRGLGEIIAVMDSGIDTGHCCFSATNKIVDNREWGGGVLGALCGFDHGTHVSGTAACSNAGDHDGLAPDAQLIMQDIQNGGFAACSLGSVSPPGDLTGAWQDAYDRGARIHTNSWGGGGNSYGGSARSMDQYMWEHPDFLILFAAGNGGSGSGSLGSYSNAKNSITVGGTKNGSNMENMYNSSSRGPAGDGRMLPDLLAPAQGVSSAQNKSTPSCGFRNASGTSMATPAMAGSATLVREYYQRGFWPSGAASAADGFSPSAALIKATMLVSARNMTGSGTRGDRPNSDQGYGRVTLDDALWFGDDPPAEQLAVIDDRDTATGLTAAGEEDVYEIGLRSPAPLKVMLAWTDAPGTPSASKALVNDLDLVVTLADGTTYRGNQGFSGGWTTEPATTADRLNNKEGVLLSSPLPGPVTITVHAETIGDVALHPQDYALVVVADTPLGCTDASGATGVGNSASLELVGGELQASWVDAGAPDYVVYRGASPDFMAQSPAAYQEGVTDGDPAAPGIQWTDGGAAGDGASHYYVFFSRDDCGALIP